MRAPAYVALGIAAYLVFLAATLPANIVVERARRAMPLDVHASFDDVRGTIWNGSLRARIDTPAPLTVDRIAWRLLPSRLAAGELAFALDAASPSLSAKMQAARAFDGWRLRDVAARADASAFVAFAPVLAAFRPAGPLELNAASLEWNRREARGEARLEWRDAATSLAEIRPLGSYRLTWRGEGETGRLAVATLQGPLHFVGEGTTTPQGAVQFTGEARAEPQAAKALAPLLDLIGPARPDGARAIALRR